MRSWRRVIALVAVGLTVSLGSPAQTCPTTANPLGPDQWWESAPAYADTGLVQLDLTFSNEAAVSIEFPSAPASTLQLWTIPSVVDLDPVLFITPAGSTVLPGETYQYTLVVDANRIALSESGFGFRPISVNLGTLSPGEASLVSADYACAPPTSAPPPAPRLWHTSIDRFNVNLRGSPVTLGQIDIETTQAGRVVVQFDGYGIVSPGDRIVLAASDEPDWNVNDGSVGIEAFNADQNRRPFSHSRSYLIASGAHSFYAVSENWVEQAGTGMASIYGSLTVKFFPDSSHPVAPIARFTGVQSGALDLRSGPVELANVPLNLPVAGSVLVRFDGYVVSTAGDRILLAASNTADWQVNSGHTSVEAFDADLNQNPFSHSRLYPVEAGSHTFYAVAEGSSIEAAGSGTAFVYGSLSVEFIPAMNADVFQAQQAVNVTNANFAAAPLELGVLSFASNRATQALVRFDATGIGSSGDRILMAASDIPDWRANSGHVSFEPVDADVNRTSLSHSRVYRKPAGPQSFYAVGEQSSVEDAGTGVATSYGHLTAQLFNVEDIFSDSFED